MNNNNIEIGIDSSLTLRVAGVSDAESVKGWISKTPIAILSVSEESHSSNFCQEIATVASRPRNDVQVFCTSTFINNKFRDSSLTLRVAEVLNVNSSK